MKLEIIEPAVRHIYEDVEEVIADGHEGSFALLPNHVDYASALTSGLVTIVDATGEEQYAAVDRGVLTKVGDEVSIATPRSVVGKPLGEIRATIEREFVSQEQHDRRMLTSMTRLQTDMARKIFERDRET
jgi:F-type H+-transporting ATPase subunit epsilon